MAIAMNVLLEVTITATHFNALTQCRQKWGQESKCQINFSLHGMSAFVIINNDIFKKGKAIKEFIRSVQFTDLAEHISINIKVAKRVYVDLWQSDSQLHNFTNKQTCKTRSQICNAILVFPLYFRRNIFCKFVNSLYFIYVRTQKMAIIKNVLVGVMVGGVRLWHASHSANGKRHVLEVRQRAFSFLSCWIWSICCVGCGDSPVCRCILLLYVILIFMWYFYY